jgi:hypothetical protein
VVAENLRRRHLEISQRAAIPVKSGILDKLEGDAKQRMVDGAKGSEKIHYPTKAAELAGSMFLVNRITFLMRSASGSAMTASR